MKLGIFYRQLFFLRESEADASDWGKILVKIILSG
jgi:hypothetical protein